MRAGLCGDGRAREPALSEAEGSAERSSAGFLSLSYFDFSAFLAELSFEEVLLAELSFPELSLLELEEASDLPLSSFFGSLPPLSEEDAEVPDFLA